MASINIELVNRDDMHAIAEHLEKIFFLYEPVMQSMGVVPTVDFWLSNPAVFSDNLSLKAVNADGQIVGLFLSRIIRKSSNMISTATGDDNTSKKWRMFLALIQFMDDAADIFGRYPGIDYYVSGGTLSVDPDYRSSGIGSKLFGRLVEMCSGRNLPMLEVYCTSLFTAKICEKFAMNKITEIAYRDIKLHNFPTLNIPEPHTHARNYVLDLRTIN